MKSKFIKLIFVITFSSLVYGCVEEVVKPMDTLKPRDPQTGLPTGGKWLKLVPQIFLVLGTFLTNGREHIQKQFIQKTRKRKEVKK